MSRTLTSVLRRGRLFGRTVFTTRSETMTPSQSRSGAQRRSRRNALSVNQARALSRPSRTPVPAQEVAKVSKNKAARRAFWLIATRTHGRMEVLTIDASGETVLPVFGFQEEGEFFLGLEATKADW
jgi:hypothetical protein